VRVDCKTKCILCLMIGKIPKNLKSICSNWRHSVLTACKKQFLILVFPARTLRISSTIILHFKVACVRNFLLIQPLCSASPSAAFGFGRSVRLSTSKMSRRQMSLGSGTSVVIWIRFILVLLLSPFTSGQYLERRKDWFSSLFGFVETDYATAKAKLVLGQDEQGRKIIMSQDSNKSYLAGEFRTPKLSELRSEVLSNQDVKNMAHADSVLTLDFVYGDVSALHANEQYRHATFQAASQFNCLEFISPNITPEHGISGYEHDRTQGPACSIACGAGTAYRNYFHKWTNQQGKAMVS
jgi:hypothetical protein